MSLIHPGRALRARAPFTEKLFSSVIFLCVDAGAACPLRLPGDIMVRFNRQAGLSTTIITATRAACGTILVIAPSAVRTVVPPCLRVAGDLAERELLARSAILGINPDL